jgi:putative transposase
MRNTLSWCVAMGRVNDVSGCVVHLRDYGLIRLFKIVDSDGDIAWWAGNDLTMRPLTRVRFASYGWMIEHYHRSIKPFCGVGRARVRAAHAAQSYRLGAARVPALAVTLLPSGDSGFEAKHAIIRNTVRAYLAHPLYQLNSTA